MKKPFERERVHQKEHKQNLEIDLSETWFNILLLIMFIFCMTGIFINEVM